MDTQHTLCTTFSRYGLIGGQNGGQRPPMRSNSWFNIKILIFIPQNIWKDTQHAILATKSWKMHFDLIWPLIGSMGFFSDQWFIHVILLHLTCIMLICILTEIWPFLRLLESTEGQCDLFFAINNLFMQYAYIRYTSCLHLYKLEVCLFLRSFEAARGHMRIFS